MSAPFPSGVADPENYLFFTEFLIVLRENDAVIGSIDFKYVPKNGSTEVGYGLNPAYQGHGYMTEALKAFLSFGKGLGLKSVLADTRKDNIRTGLSGGTGSCNGPHRREGRQKWKYVI